MITLKCLADERFGRWGNQLFSYVTGKALARKFNCELQVPNSWIGRKMFQIPESDVSVNLPPNQLDVLPDHPDIDLYGYWQYNDAVSLYSRKDCKTWLTLKPEVLSHVNRLNSYGVYHVRRTDYVGHPKYACVTETSYLKAMEQFNLNPQHFVRISDDQKSHWSEDFLLMMFADCILRANSTFSYWAAVLSQAKVYSPIVESNVGNYEATFVEGNWPKMAHSRYHNGSNLTDLHLKEV